MTAKFISDRTGEVTVGVESTAKEMQSVRLSNYVPSQREVSSIGKRKLMTPDEVLRLPREDALVIFRGQKVLKVKKFDFTNHPESKKLRDCNARDYVPNWRVEWEYPRTVTEISIPSVKAVNRKPKEIHPVTTPPDLNPESLPKPAVTTEETKPIIIPPPVPDKPPKRKAGKNAGEKKLQGQLNLTDYEPFGAIDIDDVLSDL
jgi:hypothetical protein